MKKNKSTALFAIGTVLTTLGLTILNDNKMLQYTALSLGIIIGIYGAFKADKERKEENKISKH